MSLRKFVCEYCGDTFYRNTSRQECCSYKCAHMLRPTSGSKNPNWRGGTRKAGDKEVIRVISRLIPIKPCEICGAKTKVDRHHTDYSSPLSISFLCRRCHIRVHSAVRELKEIAERSWKFQYLQGLSDGD